jgi:anaerobic selenocysteine-containing dehydrogenase
MMRDRGTWLEEDNIYRPQERPLYMEDGKYIVDGHEYKQSEVERDKYGTLLVDDHLFGGKKAIGIEIDGEIKEGFHTLSKKLEFYSQWLKEWKWPEYAIPIYPTTKGQRKRMVHIVTQVHHDFMQKDNEFALNTIFKLPYDTYAKSINPKISQNYNPIWINSQDAKKLGIKRGDIIKCTITDTVSKLESGYFIAMAIPTESTMPGVVASSHHAGRWKLKNAVDIPGFRHRLGIMGIETPLYDMSMDGKIGRLKPKGGLDRDIVDNRDTWQFKEFNRDLENIWWDGLSGSWQNAVAPSHPDPITGNHAWYQKITITKASKEDKIGDIYVNYENNFKVYQEWREKLTRPLDSSDTLRRPIHIKRPAMPLTPNAYSIKLG